MTALEEIKKAFPNMFRPLKWHHFDGPTEHGCGEWYAHATRGMYHIYDVREKFPNDRPFYAKELSDQFDTLEQAQDAVQNRHELDIVMCLDPDFRSSLESLQGENERLRQFLFPYADRTDISGISWDGKYLIGDKASIRAFHEMKNRGEQIDVYKRACDQNEAALKARAEAAEAQVKRLQAEIDRKSSMPGDHRYWEGRYREEAADNELLRSVLRPMAEVAGDVSESWTDDAQVVTEIGHFRRARAALASTGGKHHGN